MLITAIVHHFEQPEALYPKACLRCAIGTRCAGEAIRRLTANGIAVFVRHVPADICDVCGSEYFENATLAQLHRLLAEATDAGIGFADVDYRAGSVFRNGGPREHRSGHPSAAHRLPAADHTSARECIPSVNGDL